MLLCFEFSGEIELIGWENKLEELMVWGRMKFQTNKSRSLVLKSGKLIFFYYMLCGEEIPTIQEQPVKSLCHWYTEELRDTTKVQETSRQVNEGLESIKKMWLAWEAEACSMVLCHEPCGLSLLMRLH